VPPHTVFVTISEHSFCLSYNMMSDTVHFVIPKNQPVVELDCTTAFRGLTTKEKLYAHYLSQASWHGGLIVLVQVSINRGKLLYGLHGLSCRGLPVHTFSICRLHLSHLLCLCCCTSCSLHSLFLS